VVAAYDVDRERLSRFCAYWQLPAVADFEALFAAKPEIILNLTNPHAHYEVSRACLEAGVHVYSEKPLATKMDDAEALCALGREKGLQIASAPCSMLGQSAQTAWRALQTGAIGTPRLVYAELDDDFIIQAPLEKWSSASGTAWPVEDELQVGCTLEHAGYYLTWLMMMFGPVETVVAASAQVTDSAAMAGGAPAPDYSSATLFFRDGMVARLTCSILAPHDHRLRVFGEKAVLELEDCWNNMGRVKARSRFVVRRRLVNSPIAKTMKAEPRMAHPTVPRRGAASMNFALGPAEMLAAVSRGQASLLSGDFALHLTEVSLAIQASGSDRGSQRMKTSFAAVPPIDWPRVLAEVKA
jgi:predicted dehydrogenase